MAADTPPEWPCSLTVEHKCAAVRGLLVEARSVFPRESVGTEASGVQTTDSTIRAPSLGASDNLQLINMLPPVVKRGSPVLPRVGDLTSALEVNDLQTGIPATSSSSVVLPEFD